MNPVRELRSHAAVVASGYDPGVLSGDEAVCCLRDLGLVRRLVDGMIAGTAARIDEAEAHRGRGDRSAAETCSKALGGSGFEGRGMVEAGKAMGKSDALAEAVRSGRLSAAQATMIGQTTAVAPEAEAGLLAAAAQGLAPLRDACIEARRAAEDEAARAQRQRRSRRLRTWTDLDGMFAGSFALTPEIGGQIKALIDDYVGRALRARRGGDDQEPLEAYAADALTEAFLGVMDHTVDDSPLPADDQPSATDTNDPRDAQAAPDQPETRVVDDRGDVACPDDDPGRRADHGEQGRARPRRTITTHVVIDLEALLRGATIPGERCEIPGVGPVNVEWVRAHLPEAFLTAVIAHGTDIRTVAHFGRHINAKLRTALLVQGRECDVSGCSARGYLEIDHSHDHAKRGPTALANLGWLCAHHHRLKTGGWILGPRDPTGKRTLAPPRPAARTESGARGPDPPADAVAA
jgi:hypothetical protein